MSYPTITVNKDNWTRMLPFLVENRAAIEGTPTRSQDDEDDEYEVWMKSIELSDKLEELPGSDANPWAYGGIWLTPNGTLLYFPEGYSDTEEDLKLYRIGDASTFDPTADDWIKWDEVKKSCGVEDETELTPAMKLRECLLYHAPENWDSYPLVITGAHAGGTDDEVRIRWELKRLLNLQVGEDVV